MIFCEVKKYNFSKPSFFVKLKGKDGDYDEIHSSF